MLKYHNASRLQAIFGLASIAKSSPERCYACGFAQSVQPNLTQIRARSRYINIFRVPKMINARAERVADKPAFRAAFRHRRCLIPALGFYEWEHKTKIKQPYFVRLTDAGILAFAGLWEHWQGEDGEIIESCTIITTEANTTVGKIHDRMPAIIEQAQYEHWLDPKGDKEKLPALLKPFPDNKMLVYPVGKEVNNPKNQCR